MSQVIFELLIRFSGQDQAETRHLKEAVCAWLMRKGRQDYVQGIVDGVLDSLSDQEHKDASVDDARMKTAPIALYDRDRAVLEGIVHTLQKKFAERLAFAIHDLPDEAWNSSWREEFQPWQTSAFYIVPKDCNQSSPSVHLHRIEIDARGGAFGTGQHSTTRCLIAMMEALWTQWRPASVLDVGAGTGILSIVAAKLGAGIVRGTEIDHELVALARENANRNSVPLTMFETAHPWDGKNRYDLVIANILVPVLHDLMPELQQCCRIGGRLLVSGFIGKEAEPIVAKALSYGFAKEYDLDEGGWNGIAFVRIS